MDTSEKVLLHSLISMFYSFDSIAEQFTFGFEVVNFS